MKRSITTSENRLDPLIAPGFQAELCLSGFYESSPLLTTDTYDQFPSYSVLVAGAFQTSCDLHCPVYPDLRNAIESVFDSFLAVPENPIARLILDQTTSTAAKFARYFQPVLARAEALLFRFYGRMKTILSRTAVLSKKHCQLVIRRWDGVHSLYKSLVPVYVFSALPPPLVES